MRRSRLVETLGGFFFVYLLVCATGAVGWVMNLLKILGAMNDPMTTMLILRVVGLFAFPLGAILGFL